VTAPPVPPTATAPAAATASPRRNPRRSGAKTRGPEDAKTRGCPLTYRLTAHLSAHRRPARARQEGARVKTHCSADLEARSKKLPFPALVPNNEVVGHLKVSQLPATVVPAAPKVGVRRVTLSRTEKCRLRTDRCSCRWRRRLRQPACRVVVYFGNRRKTDKTDAERRCLAAGANITDKTTVALRTFV
jgi:hypothetical protein